MAIPGFYRRILPSPPAIDFSSSQGKLLFKEALEAGTMEGFFPLISNFHTQAEPAFCGLASLVVALNALAIDPGRPWKGPWRWFDESMLDCCEPLDSIRRSGITFAKVACLARCAGAAVVEYRANQSSEALFRRHVTDSCSRGERHLVASYSRKALEQTGEGHFSPVGGYHAASDMVLLLDVARFKYPPHWVPLPLLWQAMSTEDVVTGRSRGYMQLAKPLAGPALLFTLSCHDDRWREVSSFLNTGIRSLLEVARLASPSDVVNAVMTNLPAKAEAYIGWVAEVRAADSTSAPVTADEMMRLEAKGLVLRQLRSTRLYKLVHEWTKASKQMALTPESNSINLNALRVSEAIDLETSGSSSFPLNEGQGPQPAAMLVPAANSLPGCCIVTGGCSGRQPQQEDLLTVLLLACPSTTWHPIQVPELRAEMEALTSTGSLAPSLKQEVLHVQGQASMLRDDVCQPAPNCQDFCSAVAG